MKKRFILFSILPFLCSSCGGASMFDYELNFDKGYNKNLWYKNDLLELCADPSVVKGDDGYFYMYMTTDALGTSGFHVYRSKQLNHWENLGPAFIPDPYSWGVRSLWAPNVIEIEGKYYLYYSASNYETGKAVKGISVAVSDHPAGPFHEYEGLDANGRTITRNMQIFDFGFPCIDAAPFKDDNGDLYLYFCKDQVDRESVTYGVKLIDPVTPDLSTLTPLTRPGLSTLESDSIDIPWERQQGGGAWNEAPCMIKIKDKYVLTYSANMFTAVSYAVGYATSNSPLGTFTKPNSYECENLLLGVDPKDQDSDWDFMSGTGHHDFFYVGDELYIAYHAHIDRYFGNSLRAFALDRVVIDDDGTLFVNGPSYSLQPLPSEVSGYRNIALDATVTSIDADDVSLLVDEKIPYHQFRPTHVDLQTKFPAGEHTIELTFDEPKVATAVAIYNSVSYDTGIYSVKSVEIEGVGTAKNVPLNKEYSQFYKDEFDTDYLRPGSSFVVEFNEGTTNKVTITIESDHDFALSEIMILGKDA